MKVQQHKEKNDCGLFAIAFATGFANGIQPGHCVFKQSEMLFKEALKKKFSPCFQWRR